MSVFTSFFNWKRHNPDQQNDIPKSDNSVNYLWKELFCHLDDKYHLDNVVDKKQIDVLTAAGKSKEVDDYLDRFGCQSTLKDDVNSTNIFQRICKCGDENVTVTVFDREIKLNFDRKE